MGQLVQESILDVDAFNKPMVLEGKEAIGTLLVRLIKLEPGTFASRPTMGVGLLSNYRYCDEQKVLELQGHIRSQIQTFLPQFQAVDVATNLLEDGRLIIDIIIDEILYRYETEQQTDDNRIIGIHSIQ